MKNLKGLFGVGVSVLLLLPLSAGATITTQSATLNGASTATVDVGASVTATVTANITSNNDWHGTEWRISTTSPGTMTCFNTPDHDNGSGVSTESFGITAPTLTGTYNVYFQARGGSTCNGAQGGVLAMIGALTVTSGGAASAAISADSTTVEAGTGLVTLTITLRDQYGNLVADNTSATLLSTLGTINGSGNTVNGVMTRTLSSNQIGSATLSFSGMTMSGNTSIVFQDTTAPTITLLGSNPQTVLVGQAYTCKHGRYQYFGQLFCHLQCD
jgi:MSHA biogenesis protein MshQ